MRDAAIERLSKIISDTPTKDDGSGDKSRKPLFEMHIGLAEGWFSLVLLAIVVYSTIWCVQAVGWVDHLGVLSLTTGLGLIADRKTTRLNSSHPSISYAVFCLKKK